MMLLTGMSDGGRDRRKHPRIAVRMGVEVETIDHKNRATGEICDMNAQGGAFISMSDPLPAGTKIHLRFEVPLLPSTKTHQIDCVGFVVWSALTGAPLYNTSGIGIQIEHLGPTEVQVIATFLKSQHESNE